MINKLIGDLPKIGIRPALDGRMNGIRESLEVITMAQAKSVAKFLRENIKYPNGNPVEVIISKTTIGGVAEAAICEEEFRKENVTATITVTKSWCYGTETMDLNPLTQKAIWGFNGTERPGAVYLNAVNAAHDAFGLPAFSIYSKDVQNKDDDSIPNEVKKKLLIFSKAALAVGMMKGKTYLSVGGVSMGIVGSLVSQPFFQKYLGMRNEFVDMSEIIRRIEQKIYDEDEFNKALDWVNNKLKIENWDSNKDKKISKKMKEEVKKTSIKMTLIMKDLMVGNKNLRKIQNGKYKEESLGHNAILSGFQGQRQWTDFMPNGDFMEAILNTSFDWNGRREPYLVATENDSLNGVGMLFGHLLTNTSQIFADMRTYWSPSAVKEATGWEPKTGFIHLLNSGPAALEGAGIKQKEKILIKPWYETNAKDILSLIQDTTWHMGTLDYFRGGGLSSRFRTKGNMPITITRICITDKLGPYIQVIEGYSIELPGKVHDILDKRTDPTWPTTWFVPKPGKTNATNNAFNIMNNWGSNHCAASYGHIGEEIIALASMLRIPVSMHNVEDERIFRPKTWMNFGTENLEASDFRACNSLGPIYGK